MQPDEFAALVTLTVKAALAPVLERLSAAEARLSTQPATEKTLTEIRDRVLVVETKAAIPGLEMRADATLVVDVRERLAALEKRLQDESLTKELGALRERVAVVEVRPVVPGPQGEPGPPGKDGYNGKDGTAGLSFEGVYQDGKSYDFGQLVTWAGSSWHCNEPTTTKPGDGSKAWTLMVKRGRDGKDGHDAPGALPVVRTQ
jgi:hypothetical protein